MKKMKEILHRGSLMTVEDGSGSETCVGYLICHEGRVYEPDMGQIAVRPEEAETHNRLLTEALIEGLDSRCEVGQGGTFYLGQGRVTAWTGETVSEDVTVRGASVTFRRKGKVFRGRIRKDQSAFNFRRVS